MKRIELPEAWRARALVLTDVDVDPEHWLTDAERDLLASFAQEKRRREWLTTRVAVKQLALERDLCFDPRTAVVERPRTLGHYISMSHSSPYGAAAMSHEPIGIDVQTVRDVSERAAHLFLSDEETAAMEQCAIAHRLLHFWCAKEAAWKQRGGEVLTLRRVPLALETQRDDGLTFDRVETVSIDDVIVALTRPTS